MFILTAPMNVIKENMLWENGCNAYEFLLTTVADCIEENASATPTPTSAHYRPGAWSTASHPSTSKPIHGHGNLPRRNRRGMRQAFHEYLHPSAPDHFLTLH